MEKEVLSGIISAHRVPDEYTHITKHLVSANMHLLYFTDVYGNLDNCKVSSYDAITEVWSDRLTEDVLEFILDDTYEDAEIPDDYVSCRALLPDALNSYFNLFGYILGYDDYERVISLLYEKHISGLEPYEVYSRAYNILNRLITLKLYNSPNKVSDESIREDELIQLEIESMGKGLDDYEQRGVLPEKLNTLLIESMTHSLMANSIKIKFDELLDKEKQYKPTVFYSYLSGYDEHKNKELKDLRMYLIDRGNSTYIDALKNKYSGFSHLLSCPSYTDKIYKQIEYYNTQIRDTLDHIFITIKTKKS